MRAEHSLTRRSLPIALPLRFWVSLLSLWLIFASPTSTASQVHPVGPVALVGAQLLDGYEVAPISDGVVVYEDGVITAVGSVSDV
ncbi:MAG: hypothetical protein VX388_05545, partial [Pseudomonadota bacterium]|nr:hypothetical protein [Pseudomonadota bacterium]